MEEKRNRAIITTGPEQQQYRWSRSNDFMVE